MPLDTAHIEETFTSKEEGVKGLLLNILSLNLQYETNEKSIVSIINRFLSTAKYRKEGLEYLSLLINRFSSSIIAENALNWVNHCIVKFHDDILRELKLRVIGVIIEVAHNESDFNKKFISDFISKVLDNCVTTSHINPYECKTALTTLTTAIKCYATWFGPHRQKIEKYVLIFLDSGDSELVEAAALAFHYLQQVGSAGSNGINHKQNFTHNFHKLCRSVHECYDKFFENERELFRPESSGEETFQFEDDPTENPQAVLHCNTKRIRNILKFIETMIKTRYPVAKETKPIVLLSVISRATSIHKCITGENVVSLETYQFSILLLDIQCAALKMLRLFIIWYQANCLPYSYSISKVIVECIQRNHNCDCYKSDNLYQESAYRVLSEWLPISKSSLHSQFQSHLLECILKDITPVKVQVTLTISEAAPAKQSQKAKRKAMVNRIISSGNQPSSKETGTISEKSNEKNTCRFALTALKYLLEYSSLNVKSNLLKELYKSVFDSLLTIQSAKPLPPYTDPHCQSKLYEVLVAFYHQNTLTVLPPLHTGLDILNRGVNSMNRFVVSICHQGLRTIETFCQPVCPSLYIGLEREDESDDVELPKDVEEDDMEVGDVESRMHVERSDSVDFDASTDEFPNHNGTTGTHDSSTETAYHVRYTDTDRSSVDDGLSDKGIRNEEVEMEELDFDPSQTEKTEIGISDCPVVTAPSEDGNEILDGQNMDEPEQEVVESEKEQQDESFNENLQDNVSKDTESERQEINESVEKNNSKSTEIEEIIIDSSSCSNCSSDVRESNENEVVVSTAADVQETQMIDAKKVDDKNGQAEEEKSAENTDKKEEDSDGPAAKKPKISTEDDAVVETGDKKEDDDPDASYLEEDSFVDEVKDYY